MAGDTNMSSPKKFAKLITNDITLNRVQENISTLMDYIQVSPLTGSVSTVEISFIGTAPVIVNHKLNRIPVGFIVTDIDANQTIYRSGAFTLLSVELVASGTVNTTILFF